MRIIPIQLLCVTPRQQLLGQIREYTMMCKDIYIYGRVNHILINKINDYPIVELYIYGEWLKREMIKRKYKLSNSTVEKWNKYLGMKGVKIRDDIYTNWFTSRYIKQVLYNWQEKYDCGGISSNEWNKILDKFSSFF